MSGINSKELEIVQSPDIREVCSLLNRIWKRPEWEFTEEMLENYLNRSSGDPTFSYGGVLNGVLVGYLAYFPYIIKLNNKKLNIVFGSFWTAENNMTGLNIGLKLQRVLMHRAKSEGMDAFLTITEAQSQAEKALKLVMSRIGFSLFQLCTFSTLVAMPEMLSRRLNNCDEFELHVRDYQAIDKHECLRLVSDFSKHLDLFQVHNINDIDYLMLLRHDTHTWICEKTGEIIFLINIVVKTLIHHNEKKIACIEHIAYKDIEYSDFSKIWAIVLRDSIWNGIQGIFIPDTKYYNRDWFLKLGFIESGKKKSLFFIDVEGATNSRSNISNFYFDVY